MLYHKSEIGKVVFAIRNCKRRLVLDPRTQKPKGFGFVTFDSESQAQKALKAMNGRIVDGRLLFVEVAKSINSGEDASA
ncbi:small RNA-binding protein 11, chloroplastic isoform X5 [Ricinus communis]|uniref:small RNA-binding protein 11, chloroplastic isoform X5 n=1 Tax=Ricinus communis TaxID=3988 RepID=UPI00201B1515|nr:small RNA-binding protein 11, chloroplastic isoform X5 [Ricinus communis]